MIFLRHFEINSDFKEDRMNRYFEPWVSLTEVDDIRGDVETLTLEGDDTVYAYAFKYNDGNGDIYMFYQTLGTGTVNRIYEEGGEFCLDTNDMTFYFYDYLGDGTLEWGDEDGATMLYTSGDPSVGDTVRYYTQAGECGFSKRNPEVGTYSTSWSLVSAVTYGPTKMVTIERVDYNKSPYENELEVPLSFEIISGGTIEWIHGYYGPSKYIEYKKNDGDWTWFTEEASAITVSAGDFVQFRGDNTFYAQMGEGLAPNNYFGDDGSCRYKVYGNIMSLITSSGYSFLNELSEYALAYIFYSCSGLTDASELLLPVTALTSDCYNNMFSNCVSLTTPPKLPATVLANSCYGRMFSNCRSLVQAPELPATTLATGCYSSMFEGCISLTDLPKLPATTLASQCYTSMFSGCEGITTVPSNYLPVLDLRYECYNHMFYHCTNLTNAPELPATILKDRCYEGMFRACTSLTIAPKLPAMEATYYCYRYMFYGCTSLTVAPELPATTLRRECYSSMFNGCTSLTVAPELPATTVAERCYDQMFQYCTSLTRAPELPATALTSYCYTSMFQECTNLNYIKCLAVTNISNNCSSWLPNNTGTFIKHPDAVVGTGGWQRSIAGIPTNWTIQDAEL